MPTTPGLHLTKGQAVRQFAPAARTFDVIVIGATETGIMSAVSAARQGKSILLVSDTARIGGISGDGITVTDAQALTTSGMIGGLSREFFTRIAQKNVVPGDFVRWIRSGGGAKPSWYDQAWRSMLEGHDVTILYSASVSSITKTGAVITSATINGTRYTAKVFIDATPAGDLIQKAVTSKSIGRESTAMYGESGVGVQAASKLGFSPYVTAGNAASGLLPGVSASAQGTVGSGDGRVMTFGWRFFCTSKASEKIAFPAPDMAQYNPLNYELLARMWAGNAAYYNDATLALDRTFQVYPNEAAGYGSSIQGADPYHYIDLNSNGFLSSNYPHAEENLEYVTALPARRAQIEAKAKQYVLGLFHFILNSGDARVPANLKAGLQKYGPSKLELQGSGGITTAFYVREGCRVVGEYVMTRAAAVYDNGVWDPIAWGDYDFDGHPVRIIVVDGEAAIEGSFHNLMTPTTAGFPIPLRVLMPKRAEATNLLCPGQPSVSRFVHTAVRAIPVIMMLGDAAGVAAALAINGNGIVQDVDYTQLAKMQNILNKYPADAYLTADGYTGSGSRTESGAGVAFAQVTGANRRWGVLGDFAMSVPAGTDRKVRYSPNIFRSGLYRVYWTYPATAAADILNASNVTVKIGHADGVSTRTVNQRFPGGDGGLWDDLGTFYFVKGSPNVANYVEIDANGSDGRVVDSGLKFVAVDAEQVFV